MQSKNHEKDKEKDYEKEKGDQRNEIRKEHHRWTKLGLRPLALCKKGTGREE